MSLTHPRTSLDSVLPPEDTGFQVTEPLDTGLVSSSRTFTRARLDVYLIGGIFYEDKEEESHFSSPIDTHKGVDSSEMRIKLPGARHMKFSRETRYALIGI